MKPARLQSPVLALTASLALLPLLAPPAPANAQTPCTFVLGFATLRGLIGPAVVGTCLADERFNPLNGNAEQPTSGGLLVWRKADNWTAFTDGYRTWINGPEGLAERLNAQRFAWEASEADPQPAAAAAQYPGLPPGLPGARVIRVVDGDTADVAVEGEPVRLRLLGIDTPEVVDPRAPVQCFGREASAKALELLDGQALWLEADPSQDERDAYGRLLRYVWLGDGRLVNLELVAQGYAHEYTFRLPYRYQALFRQAAQAAREQGLGLWSPAACNGDTTQPAAAATPPPAPTAPPPAATATLAAAFDPTRYLGRADAFNCPDFRSQAQAQAVLRAGPSDRNRPDAARDGIACERNAGPYDLTPVTRR